MAQSRWSQPAANCAGVFHDDQFERGVNIFGAFFQVQRVLEGHTGVLIALEQDSGGDLGPRYSLGLNSLSAAFLRGLGMPGRNNRPKNRRWTAASSSLNNFGSCISVAVPRDTGDWRDTVGNQHRFSHKGVRCA